MQKPIKLRVSYNEACSMLSIKRDALSRLIKTDNKFPKPIKEGSTKQAPVYFDYQDLVEWWNEKKPKL